MVEDKTDPFAFVTVVVTAPLPVVATVVVLPLDDEVVVTVLTTSDEDPEEAVVFEDAEPGAADSNAEIAAFNDAVPLPDPAAEMPPTLKFIDSISRRVGHNLSYTTRLPAAAFVTLKTVTPNHHAGAAARNKIPFIRAVLHALRSTSSQIIVGH